MARAPQYIINLNRIESLKLDFNDFEMFDKFKFHPINLTKASFDAKLHVQPNLIPDCHQK